MRPAPVTEGTRRNIEAVRDLEAEFQTRRTRVERATDALTSFVGSLWFLLAQVVFLLAWVLLNAGAALGLAPFDPYPFQFLNFAVGLEAIFLSTFVLMTQNRQSQRAEHWARLGLQIGLLAEQESTKVLEMLRDLSGRMGMGGPAHDPELKEMIRTTHVEEVAGEMKRADEAPGAPPEGG